MNILPGDTNQNPTINDYVIALIQENFSCLLVFELLRVLQIPASDRQKLPGHMFFDHIYINPFEVSAGLMLVFDKLVNIRKRGIYEAIP